jgi:SulP family sulfate permease
MIDLLIKRQKNIKNDLLSGLTVSLALIPEAIAFAFVAGVDPLVGLWAAFFVGFITAAIGGRPGMISGATGAMAVVMTAFVVLYGVEYLFAAVVMCGAIQIFCGVFKLGKFVRLIPHPVMLGFVNGLAIVIGKAQFGQLKDGHQVVYNHAAGTFEIISHWMSGAAMLVTLGIIVLTMAIIHFLPKCTRVIPGTLAAIITVTLIVQFVPIDAIGDNAITVENFVTTQEGFAAEKAVKSAKFETIKPTTLYGDLQQTGFAIAAMDFTPEVKADDGVLPTFKIPMIENFDLHAFSIIFGLGLTLAAIGLIESLMTLTLIDELTETRGSGNRECIGQGVANVVSGLFGTMGGCAMIGQSMINIRSGGRGRLSGIAAAIFLLCFVIIEDLWVCIGMIPVAALIGVMFIVVIATFEWTSLRLWNKIPKSDFLIIVLVSTITVIFDLAIAVIAGVVLSALIFAWKKSRRISAEITEEEGHKTYILTGPLFFGAVSHFKDIFQPVTDPQNVSIEFKACRVYDYSALEAIGTVSEKYNEQGKKIKLKHLSTECQALLNKAGNFIEVDENEDPHYYIAH